MPGSGSPKRQKKPRLPAAWLALAAGLALPPACGPARGPEAAPELELRIPAGEDPLSGSYAVIVRWPDRPADRIAGRREGSVTGLWFLDLDQDDRGEVVVALNSGGSGSFGELQAWSREETGEWRPRELPELGVEQTAGYMGHDFFEVVDGVLHRRFPIYREEDPNNLPTGGLARFALAKDDSRWVELP